MRLRYTKHDGTQMEFHLSEQPITIGRSPEADIVLMDEKASRIHCGIRLWDGEFYLKDLKSKNGTFVNGERIEVCKLKSSDNVRIGATSFNFEQDPEIGQETALRDVNDQMDLGKGYTTILREIVDDVDEKHVEVAIPASDSRAGTDVPRVPLPEEMKPERAPPTTGIPRRKPIKITIKRRS